MALNKVFIGQTVHLVDPVTGAAVTPASASGVTVTLVDNSITSATGSSQVLLAANTARKKLTIINPKSSTTDWSISPLGGTVVADTPPAFRLSPGDEYSPNPVPTNAISGIGTAASKLIVLEG